MLVRSSIWFCHVLIKNRESFFRLNHNLAQVKLLIMPAQKSKWYRFYWNVLLLEFKLYNSTLKISLEIKFDHIYTHGILSERSFLCESWDKVILTIKSKLMAEIKMFLKKSHVAHPLFQKPCFLLRSPSLSFVTFSKLYTHWNPFAFFLKPVCHKLLNSLNFTSY